MVSRWATFILVGVWAALGCGCAASTKCSPITRELSGNVEKDIVGTFDHWGTDSPVVMTFKENGKFEGIESPNMYSWWGTRQQGTWAIQDGLIVLNWAQGGKPWRYEFKVHPDKLEERLTHLEGAVGMGSHPRVTCTGFGF